MPDSRRPKITDEHREEAERLRALWSAKAGKPTQAEFGEKYDLGNQSNVGHYLNGRSALNVKAAAAFAAELGCPVSAFSPRVAEEMKGFASLNAVMAPMSSSIVAAPSTSTEFLPGFEKMAVPLLANSGSMGHGEDQLHEEVMTGSLPVSPEWAQRVLKPTALRNLRFIHGYGDSMKGTFEDGDILLVDIGVKDPRIDGVYVLEANDRIYIKRVRQRMDGEFEVSSDNPKVRTIDVLDGNTPVECRGRVLWAWNGVKL